MRPIANFIFIVVFPTLLASCNGQTKTNKQAKTQSITQKLVGGGCEGCELMYVGMPEKILPEHTSLGWTEGSQKLIMTGKVFQLDGKTPAPNTIIYYWHTDEKGIHQIIKPQHRQPFTVSCGVG